MRLLNKTINLVAQQMRQFGYDFGGDRDARVQSMKKEIKRVGGRIEFKIEQYPDGLWTAESVNLDGIITGGKNTKEITPAIRDAMFTYFGIPAYLCDDAILRADNEPIVVTQHVYV